MPDYTYVLVKEETGMNVKLVARCERHQVTLVGDLALFENPDGSWTPDTSEMDCLGIPSEDDATCSEAWTVSVVL